MKKKLTLILTTLACVVAFAFCVTACGETNNGDNTQTPSVESAKSIVGDEVDRATWDAAVSAFNKKNNYKFVCSAVDQIGVDDDLDLVLTWNYTVTVVDYYVYLKGTTDTKVIGTVPPDLSKDKVQEGKVSMEIFISDEEAEDMFNGIKENGKWTRLEELSKDVVEWKIDRDLCVILGRENICNIEFADYEYDNDLKGYRLKDNGAQEGVFIVKIKDGKVKAIYKEYESERSFTGTWDFVYMYGGQSLTVPAI